MSIQVAYRMKNKFSDDSIYTMWHDDISLGISVFFLLLIILLSFLFAHFSPSMIKIRELKKFNHYSEFEREKHLDSKFMILKQETMRIDPKLMAVDQSMFEILALQINEDDSLC